MLDAWTDTSNRLPNYRRLKDDYQKTYRGNGANGVFAIKTHELLDDTVYDGPPESSSVLATSDLLRLGENVVNECFVWLTREAQRRGIIARGVLLTDLAVRQLEQEAASESSAAQLDAQRSKSQGDKGNPSQSVRLSKNDELILVVLMRAGSRLYLVEDIARELRLQKTPRSDRVIKRTTRDLIEKGLCCRPKGDRTGATLTPEGKKAAEEISAKQGQGANSHQK